MRGPVAPLVAGQSVTSFVLGEERCGAKFHPLDGIHLQKTHITENKVAQGPN